MFVSTALTVYWVTDLNRTMNRRQFLQWAAGAACLPFAGCASHHSALMHCPGPFSDFHPVNDLGIPAYRIGPEGRAIVLLHELPGLSPDDLALARCISKEGFRVYAPLLFGGPEQDDFVKGFGQSCRAGLFECNDLSARSTILDRIETFCDNVATANGPIGVVGMCLTGVFPLALLPNQVRAAVLCQPTLPFSTVPGWPTGNQVTDLGLGRADLAEAMASEVPFLAMHYTKDRRCPVKRIEEFQNVFGARVAVIALEGDGKHSSLAGDFDPGAFADAMTYMKVRLGVLGGPQRMTKALLRSGTESHACEIDADGPWKSLGREA